MAHRSQGFAPTVGVAFLLMIALSSSGCSISKLFLGNVAPVAQRSGEYGVEDPGKEDKSWVKLESESGDDHSQPSRDISDVAYQSKTTASIISLNSSCRPGFEKNGANLSEFSKQLFLGISNVTLREVKKLKIQDSPALETTILGRLNGEKTMVRAIVVHKKDCIYDLMFVARPEHFHSDAPQFAQFVTSLRLR